MLERLGLRLRILLLFALLAAVSLGALALGLWQGYGRLGTPEALTGFVQAGLIAGFAILGVVTWLWYLFDMHVARALGRLAAGLRARAHAEVEGAFDAASARYLGDLVPAAVAVTERLAVTRGALADSVARETARLAGEKGRLEALLADVPVAVLLCSAEHQIVFYNGPAVDLLGARPGPQALPDADQLAPDSGAPDHLAPGLDRKLFDYLREAPVRHAHQRLTDAADADAAADLLCATASGARVLAGRMRLLPQGYVLTLRDVTADLAAHARREQLLSEIFERVRRPAANLQTVIGVLDAGATAPDLTRALLEEVGALTGAITELGQRYDEGRTDWWPLSQTRSSDLLDGIRARIEGAGLSVETEGAALILRCDGYELVVLVAALAVRVAGRLGPTAFRVTIREEDGPGAMLELSWKGTPLSVGDLDAWMAEPLEIGLADITGRSVLYTHGTEIWPAPAKGGRAAILMPVREARRAAGRRPQPATRAVVYDFDLLARARNDRVAETALSDLTYVVFDTETTGLSPARDEIVQIAGLRLVNGRRVAGEVFETLVDPGRPIPPGSTQVHGITDAMVLGAPRIAEAGARFHRFAEGAVLVAHNAPFDLEFLRRHEGAIGARFDNPVLDTVLLSAVIFGRGESHSLDALTARLGITIPEEARHTARGDAEATAEAFLRLIPMLRARGLDTFGAVVAEVRRHGRLLRDLNEDLR
ncbi:3'-5' exonuclease [Halodurantibacterium flavum]|uniref:DNA-directed DNA polymerase n=1 Tax=Halodurantibacterium flavum TaxID=1382802 RepID=A0ABW4S388_9RHOB